MAAWLTASPVLLSLIAKLRAVTAFRVTYHHVGHLPLIFTNITPLLTPSSTPYQLPLMRVKHSAMTQLHIRSNANVKLARQGHSLGWFEPLASFALNCSDILKDAVWVHQLTQGSATQSQKAFGPTGSHTHTHTARFRAVTLLTLDVCRLLLLLGASVSCFSSFSQLRWT